MKEHAKTLLNSYSEVFFIKSPLVGAFMLLLTLVNPNISLSGVVSVISAYLFARFIRMDQSYLDSGFYTYNPLLVGFSIGALFKFSFLSLFFTAWAGILAFLMTTAIFHVFSFYLGLPILSLPFALVSSVVYLASTKYSNLYVNGLYPHFFDHIELQLPIVLSGFLKALGAIFFLPNELAGIGLALGILFSSRILFLLAVTGYYSGACMTWLMVGSFQQAFTDINHFNFILIAMALGGIFLIPSAKSYVLALLAVVSSTLLVDSVSVFWSTFGISAFTLPFNLISLTFIYVLGLVNFPLIAKFIKSTPEDTLDYYLTNLLRFQGYERTLSLPFSGNWTVWQGFDGQWTHKGEWKFAYDFVITDEKGETFRNEGIHLEDYHAFGKPVLAPVRGRIVKVIDLFPDNPVGTADKTNNWGNLLIIETDNGFFVEISHFARNSIKVQEGDWVEKGSFLGSCGNSGYSPQPHIHVQVQGTAQVGSYTLPFSFTNYIENDHYFSNNLPKENKTVAPFFLDKELDTKVSFILDTDFSYEVTKGGISMERVTWSVKMASDGTFYFDSGKGKLYFGKYEGTFYFYRIEGNDEYLKALFISLPRLPLAYKENMAWEDFLAMDIVTNPFKKALFLLLSSFRHRLTRIRGSFVYTGKYVIQGKVISPLLNIDCETYVELDEYIGFNRIKVNDLELSRSLI